jgi:hypothetical protein
MSVKSCAIESVAAATASSRLEVRLGTYLNDTRIAQHTADFAEKHSGGDLSENLE